MARNDDDRFVPRPAPPNGGGQDGGQRFISTVLRQVSKTGPSRSGSGGSRFGRGRVAASFAGSRPPLSSRRVIIKSRFVRITPGGFAVSGHLRYIQREGVTRDGEPGQAYGADTDTADTRAFIARSQDDRHQFRFIVSPEDAAELGDLKDYTRALMAKMAVDLETRLDWVAVDHWDTDNPHTHIVLRGRADNGQDLVIAPDYLGHGMRARATELATAWLEPRTELEITQSLQREVTQERLTTLDRTLLRQAAVDVVDTAQLRGDAAYQRSVQARLQHLTGMGLARQMDARHWQLDSQLETTLRGLGDRGDIIRTMHRAMKGQSREFALHMDGGCVTPVVGRIAAKGLADELRDTGYLVVDGVDGRAHYVRLPINMDLGDLPVGGVVEVHSARDSAADRNIAAVAKDGVYRTADHLAVVKGRDSDPRSIVQSHVRRLEALRRAGIVERMEDGLWKIPVDLREKGRSFDADRTGGVTVELRSHLPLAQQAKALGATWLDEQLIDGGKALGMSGFGAQTRNAMQMRGVYLETEGLVERRGQRTLLARNLLRTLRTRELDTVAKTLTAQTGLAYQPMGDDGKASGIYRRSVMLSSGRYALLDNGRSFTLVPWRLVIEQRLGQSLSVSIQAGRATWEFGRQRGRTL